MSLRIFQIGKGAAYSWVEQTATDAIKRPCIYQKGKPVRHGDPDISAAGQSSIRRRIWRLENGHEIPCIAKVEEEECPHKLARRCDEVTTDWTELVPLMWGTV